MLIQKNRVVVMDYRLEDNKGALIDSSVGESFSFIHGTGQIIPGLEKAMEGRKKGDNFSIDIAPKDGYGEIDPSLVESVDLKFLGDIEDLTVGMQLHGQSDDGQPRVFTVKHIGDKEAVLDGNHPLAGFELKFTITVIDVRDATAEELDHGHAHGPDGHHHH